MRRIVMCCVLLVTVQRVSAQEDIKLSPEPSKESIKKAKSYLDSSQTGRLVLGFAHLGSTLNSHQPAKDVGVLEVQDGKGKRIPGAFALVYDLKFGNGDETQMAFFCDRGGNVYKVKVLASSGFPFLAADLGVELLRDPIKDLVKNAPGIGEDLRKQLLRTVSTANAQQLLEIMLKNRLQ